MFHVVNFVDKNLRHMPSLMLHNYITDGFNFDAGTSEIWKSSPISDLPASKLKPSVICSISHRSHRIKFICMLSNPSQTHGGMAHKMDCNFTMLGAYVEINLKIDHWNAYEISYF